MPPEACNAVAGPRIAQLRFVYVSLLCKALLTEAYILCL